MVARTRSPFISDLSRRRTTATSNREGPIITALFHDRDDTERAYDALLTQGISDDEISVAMSKDTRERHYGGEHEESDVGNKAAEGAGIGGAGGAADGIIGAIAAAAVAFPGIGIALSGPLAVGLAGAGGIGGSLLGGLVGAGIPEERAEHYEKGLKEGGIVLGVRPRTDVEAEVVEDVFRRSHGEHVYR